MPKDRLLWEVQTLAANVSDDELLEILAKLEASLGTKVTNDIIKQWEHELDEEDD